MELRIAINAKDIKKLTLNKSMGTGDNEDIFFICIVMDRSLTYKRIFNGLGNAESQYCYLISCMNNDTAIDLDMTVWK